MPIIIWGLRVVYRTLGRGVFFCRRCGGDRDYRHRAGRRYVTIFFIPVIPLMRTGAHVQCLTCKTRYVTEVLQLPTTVEMQVALVAGMRAVVAVILRAGDPGSPLARRRALDAVNGAGDAGDAGYGTDALEADLAEPAEAGRPRIVALGSQLQVEAREWCLAEAIRIAMADGPLTGTERAAVEHLAAALGMTQAQAIGVIALTEQIVLCGRPPAFCRPRGDDPPAPFCPRGDDPPAPPGHGGLRAPHAPAVGDGAEIAPPPTRWPRFRRCGWCSKAAHRPRRLALSCVDGAVGGAVETRLRSG